MKIRKENNAQLVRYYQQSGWWYKYFWDSGGLHHGIFEETTTTHREAVENQYQIVIKEGLIARGMRVLDVGCGVGDGVCYIAKKTGAKVTGITIVPDQVEAARNLAKREQLENLVQFQVMNFQKLSFPSNYFDVVYGIESISHSPSKDIFLNEAQRVMKVDGKLVIADGYTDRKLESPKDFKCYEQVLDGWHMYELIKIDKMIMFLKKNMLKIEKQADYTHQIGGSIKRMKLLVLLGKMFPISQGVRDNVRAMSGWVSGIEQGFFKYYLIVASKK